MSGGLCISCQHCFAYRRDGRDLYEMCRILELRTPGDIVWCNYYDIRQHGGQHRQGYAAPYMEGIVIDPRPDPPSKDKGYA